MCYFTLSLQCFRTRSPKVKVEVSLFLLYAFWNTYFAVRMTFQSIRYKDKQLTCICSSIFHIFYYICQVNGVKPADTLFSLSEYLKNGCRQRIGSYGPPVGNGTLVISIQWSHVRWCHMTLKDQGRDSNMFGAFPPFCPYQTLCGDPCHFPSPLLFNFSSPSPHILFSSPPVPFSPLPSPYPFPPPIPISSLPAHSLLP